MKFRFRWLPMVLLSVAWRGGMAQEKEPLADAGIVQCSNAKSGGMGRWVTSKAGFSAAVELGIAVTGKEDDRKCVTSWKLHVKGRDGKEHVLTVAQNENVPDDEEWEQESSFEIVGWSRDGSLLLAAQIATMGDWDETTPIVFDFITGKYQRVELYPLFKRMIPSSCNVVYRVVGFTEDGRVRIKAMSTDDDREAGTKACFAESGWNLDFRRKIIAPVAAAKKQ